jgi:hypothetical protein
VVVLILMFLGGVRPPKSGRLGNAIFITALPCAVATAAYAWLPVTGWTALFVLAGTYLVLGLINGAVRLAPLVQLLRLMLNRRTTP